jgi:hypothetical protein
MNKFFGLLARWGETVYEANREQIEKRTSFYCTSDSDCTENDGSGTSQTR